MKTIETLVPFSPSVIKEFMSDPANTELLVDITNSKIKPMQCLIYLSNIGLKSDVVFDRENMLEVLSSYLKLPVIVSLPTVEKLVMCLLLHVKGLSDNSDLFPKEWLDENKDIVMKWVSLSESLLIYGIRTFMKPKGEEESEGSDDPIIELLEGVEIDDDKTSTAVNFINLLKYPEYISVVTSAPITEPKIYPYHFDEYIYKGKNLYHHWLHENNLISDAIMIFMNNDIMSDEELDSMLTEIGKHDATCSE